MLAAQMLGDVGDIVKAVGLDQHDLHLGRRVDVDHLAAAGRAAGAAAAQGVVVHIVKR